MTKLILKILVLASIVCATVFFLFSRTERKYDSNNYFAAVIDKDSLIMSVPPPRIILAGASNLAFGVDSKLMQETLGIPVVNMGLHGNFGLGFILNNVKQNVRNGDIIILSLEYYLDELYYKDIDYVVHLYPKAESYIDKDNEFFSQYLKYVVSEAQNTKQRYFNTFFDKVLRFKEAKVFVSDQVHSYDTLIYSRKAFNSNGDVVSHLGKNYPGEMRGRTPIDSKDYSSGISRLNDFAEYVSSKGATAYFTFASYPRSEFDKNIKGIRHFEEQLRKDLKMPIITLPEDMTYPDEMFFDTVYHLNEEGRKLRTEKLVQILVQQSILR